MPVFHAHAASADERSRALAQARLPLSDMGGLGFTPALGVRHAAFAGRFAANWLDLIRYFPDLRSVDLRHSDLPSIVALRSSLSYLHQLHFATATKYAGLDKYYYDHDTFGDKQFQYHPPRHPEAASLATLSTMADPDSKVNRHAQSTFTRVHHHHAWHTHLQSVAHDRRTATVFICASQPHAGDFLNAIPTTDDTTIHTVKLRVALQHRLALPIFPAPLPPHDRYGDSLQNDGAHTWRHNQPKSVWFDLLTATYGTQYTICDPQDGSHMEYSNTHIPDVGVLFHANDGTHIIGDVKVVSPFTTLYSSVVAKARAAVLAFANTGEHYKEQIFGRLGIELPTGTTSRFNRYMYTGKKVAVLGDYRDAIRRGHSVYALIHEVFGGWAPDAVKLFRQAARAHSDEIDPMLTSWAARSFTAYYAQRISIAIHVAAATEIIEGARHVLVQANRRRGRGRKAHPMLPAGMRSANTAAPTATA